MKCIFKFGGDSFNIKLKDYPDFQGENGCVIDLFFNIQLLNTKIFNDWIVRFEKGEILKRGNIKLIIDNIEYIIKDCQIIGVHRDNKKVTIKINEIKK